MRNVVAILTLIISTSTLAGINVIYGKDNRKDVYETRNPKYLSLAKSTAGMINLKRIVPASARDEFNIYGDLTLERAQNLCSTEAFALQQVAPNCSGFLVAPDLIVTAGHCYKAMSTPEVTCKSFAWVFDYHMKSAYDEPGQGIPQENIYRCKEVINAQLDAQHDFAIIKLDRKVVGREPLKFRTSGKVDSNASLLVIGHPSGLPTKISDNGKVTLNTLRNTFSTTLDTFAGNSGSAVFDATTGQVEGILIQGKTDYHPSIKFDSKSCQVVNKCQENGTECEAPADGGAVYMGEVVYRINQIASMIKQAQTTK